MRSLGRFSLATLLLFTSGASAKSPPAPHQEPFPVGFEKQTDTFPVLRADPAARFDCPLAGPDTPWQEAYVFNPAAIVHEGRVCLLFRAEDRRGEFGGTSRIGLARSDDGVRFTKHPRPVLFADNDAMLPYENGGGVEDPRVVRAEDGAFVMTYTAFDGRIARLCVATSPDLVRWKKRGLAFGRSDGGKYRDMWSKSGAIVTRRESGGYVAARINGKYWMYWGESDIYTATSDDLIHWEPVVSERRTGKHFTAYLGNGRYEVAHGPSLRFMAAALTPRRGAFDSGLVEPGPPPVLTPEGIYAVYNGANAAGGDGDPALSDGEYAVGYAYFDPRDPTAVIRRGADPILRAESPGERGGQLANAAFTEALVHHNGRWLLYYVTGEANIGVAVGRPQPTAGE